MGKGLFGTRKKIERKIVDEDDEDSKKDLELLNTFLGTRI